jgi:hypothetical protein
MFQVLIALAMAKHGYAIIKEVDRRSAGDCLSAGTLYTIVRRFEQEGIIAESATAGRRWTTSARLLPADRPGATWRAEGRRMESALGMARAKNLIPKVRPA